MIVFISDAENAEIVLKSKDCLNKSDSFYKVVRDGLKVDGLFTSKGKTCPFYWRNERMMKKCEFKLFLRKHMESAPSFH